MTMTTWGEAFASQAASDRAVYLTLCRTTHPASHRLHYLQMWLEKLCKAYLYLSPAFEEQTRTHGVVAKVLPRLILEHWQQLGYASRPDRQAIRALCLEIDRLHPQVDGNDKRPDNVEYPWLAATGQIEVPAQWSFPLTAKLESGSGRKLMKAAEYLTSHPSAFVRP